MTGRWQCQGQRDGNTAAIQDGWLSVGGDYGRVWIVDERTLMAAAHEMSSRPLLSVTK